MTETGDDLVVTVVLPSPNTLHPQPHAHTVPLVRNPKLWLIPALTWHQSVNPPMTETGDDLDTVVPSPKRPQQALPQLYVIPLVNETMLCQSVPVLEYNLWSAVTNTNNPLLVDAEGRLE
jgi:hypothetical protein